MRFGRRHQQPGSSTEPTQTAPEQVAPVVPRSETSLKKGQVVSLLKDDGSSLEGVRMGLGWDPAEGVSSIDLDANCTAVDKKGNELFTVSFRQLQSACQSVRHTGDNLTGEGDGDDESILVDLPRLLQANREIAALYFTVCSYRGQRFGVVANASCHIVATVNGRDAKDLGTFNLTDNGDDHTALIMARIVLWQSLWHAQMVGEKANGRVASDLLGAIKEHLKANPVGA